MVHSKLMICAGACLLALLVGCKSKDNTLTAKEVRKNQHPELRSTSLTKDEHKNRRARAIHTTGRQIRDDIDEFLLIKDPSKLTEYPIP